MGFVIGEYRTVELLEPAARSVGVQSYRGEDASGHAVALTVLGDDHLDAAQFALRAVPDVQHPHLLQVEEMVQDGERCALICRWPAGGRLAELLARRHRLTVPETLTVLIPLAAALAALHAAQLRHGDVGPSTIWFDAAGRPLLGAVGVAHVAAAVGEGLPGGIREVAPEVVRGERRTGGSVTPAADIFSLGSVALRCLAGRPAWPADDPADVLVQSAAGMWPDLPDDAGPPKLVALVREMLRAEPARRPTAAAVVCVLEAVGIPEPVAFGPVPATAATSRWNGWGAPQLRVRGPAGRVRSPVGGAEGAAPDPPAVGPPPDPRRESRGTAGPLPADAATGQSRLARAGIAVLVGLLAVVIAVQVGLWWTGRDQPGAAPGQAMASTPADEEADDWLQVVTALDAARGRALDTADATVLAEVYLPQSAPAMADTRTIEDLAARGWVIRDGVHQITSVTPAPADSVPADAAAPSASDQQVRLLVVDSLPARPIVDGAGNEVGQTAARGEQRRILILVPTSHGYRISAVEPG